jgi:hypothetical protein
MTPEPAMLRRAAPRNDAIMVMDSGPSDFRPRPGMTIQGPMDFASPLPIDAALPELTAALRVGNTVVLVAPPGAGKTTRVPLVLAEEAWAQEPWAQGPSGPAAAQKRLG